MATTIKPIYVNDVNSERLYPLVSLKPGAPRPYWTFPVIPPGWFGRVTVRIPDPAFQRDWEDVVELATIGGYRIGIGRGNPGRGYVYNSQGRGYGRFRVSNVTAR